MSAFEPLLEDKRTSRIEVKNGANDPGRVKTQNATNSVEESCRDRSKSMALGIQTTLCLRFLEQIVLLLL